MSSQRQPTNQDLLKELKGMQVTVSKMDGRLEALEVWRISNEAGKSAIAEYRKAQESTIRKEVLQALVPLLVAMTGFLIYLTTRK